MARYYGTHGRLYIDGKTVPLSSLSQGKPIEMKRWETVLVGKTSISGEWKGFWDNAEEKQISGRFLLTPEQVELEIRIFQVIAWYGPDYERALREYAALVNSFRPKTRRSWVSWRRLSRPQVLRAQDRWLRAHPLRINASQVVFDG